ncbi:hypothetical protein HK405_008052, partial [Cladochytrium tenue]
STAAGKHEGAWEHPDLHRLARVRGASAFSTDDASRLVLNAVGLAVLGIAGFWADYVDRVADALAVTVHPLAGTLCTWLATLSFAVFTFNVASALYKMTQPAPRFTEFPLTPRQRFLFGLDPTVPSETSPIVEPPRYAPTATPASSRRSNASSPFTTPLLRRGVHAQSTAGRSSLGNPVSEPGSVARLSPRNYVADVSTDVNSPQISSKALLDRFLRSMDTDRKRSTTTSPAAGPATARSPLSAPPFPFASPSSAAAGPTAGSPLSFADLAARGHAALAAGAPPAFVGRYLPASPAKGGFAAAGAGPGGAGGVGGRRRERRIEGGYLVRDPDAAVAELNVAPYIDEWADNVRWWVAEKVVKPLVDRIDAVDAELAAIGLAHLSCARAAWNAGMSISAALAHVAATPPTPAAATSSFSTTSTGLFASRPAGGGGGFGLSTFGASAAPKTAVAAASAAAKPGSLFEMVQTHRGSNVLLERLRIEMYLGVGGLEFLAARDAVVERIRALARGGGLAAYNWNGSATPHAAATASSSLASVFALFSPTRGQASGAQGASPTSSRPSNQGAASAAGDYARSAGFAGAATSTSPAPFGTYQSLFSGAAGSNVAANAVAAAAMDDYTQFAAFTNASATATNAAAASARLPPDAVLVMHLVCRFLDEHTPSGLGTASATTARSATASTSLFKTSTTAFPSSSTQFDFGGGAAAAAAAAAEKDAEWVAEARRVGRTDFSDKYFCAADQRLDPTRTLQLWQRGGPGTFAAGAGGSTPQLLHRPHYDVAYRRTVLECHHGRANLFRALAVFAYLACATAGGYLGLLDLAGRNVALADAVRDGPSTSRLLLADQAAQASAAAA